MTVLDERVGVRKITVDAHISAPTIEQVQATCVHAHGEGYPTKLEKLNRLFAFISVIYNETEEIPSGSESDALRLKFELETPASGKISAHVNIEVTSVANAEQAISTIYRECKSIIDWGFHDLIYDARGEQRKHLVDSIESYRTVMDGLNSAEALYLFMELRNTPYAELIQEYSEIPEVFLRTGKLDAEEQKPDRERHLYAV